VPQRRVAVAAAALVLAALVAGSSPRRVGDGPEYLVTAMRLAALRPPALDDAEVAAMRVDLRAIGTGFEASFAVPPVRGADGRHDFPHFWFYPLLAAPGVWLAQAVGVHPNFGFTATNGVLLLAAFSVALARLDWRVALLVFGGPIVWWLDKAHTEAFTFALLAIATATLADAPWWAMIAFAAASTQNLPLAVGVALAALVGIRRWRDPRMWIGAAASVVLVALHPLYYWMRIGVPEPQTLVDGTAFHVPHVGEMGAFVWDPNLGILPNFPALALALVASVATLAVVRRRALASPPILASAVVAVVLLASFAQTTNFNSGATPGPARYGLWLVPLALPLLDAAAKSGTRWWRAALGSIAVASCATMLVAYRPSLPESYLSPTRLATFLWTHYPWLDDPLPEVFSERLRGEDLFHVGEPVAPVATPDCSKALLVAGQWPRACGVRANAPAACNGPDVYCYANRHGGGVYRFRVRGSY
jgi:hypothetical protein